MREKQSQAIGYVTKRYPFYNTPILQLALFLYLCSYKYMYFLLTLNISIYE